MVKAAVCNAAETSSAKNDQCSATGTGTGCEDSDEDAGPEEDDPELQAEQAAEAALGLIGRSTKPSGATPRKGSVKRKAPGAPSDEEADTGKSGNKRRCARSAVNLAQTSQKLS